MRPAWLAKAPPLRAPIETASSVNMIWTGDSQTQGDLWPPLFRQQLSGAVTYHNVAVGGKTLAQLLVDDVVRVDSLILPGTLNVVFAWAGTNDIALGATADQLWATTTAYIAARKAAGANLVFVGTMLPRGNALDGVFYEAQRVAFNATMRAGWQSIGASGLIDAALDNRLGAPGANEDATFFSYEGGVKVHMTYAACAIFAGFAIREYNRIRTALATA